MKRIFCIFVIVLLVVALSTSVFAEGESIIGRTFTLTEEGQGTIEITVMDESNLAIHVIFEDGSTADCNGTYTLEGDVITVNAVGGELGKANIVGDTFVPIYDDVIHDDALGAEYNTFITRIWEFIVKNKDRIFKIVVSIVTFMLLWIIKKKTNNLSTDVTSANQNSVNVVDSQSGVVGVVNTMIDVYNTFKTDFDAVKKSDTDRDKQMAAIMVTNTAILEILTRVYPNSKNLPQGVKDVVNMTYANAMKTINDDSQLAALVSASKNLLFIGTEKAASDKAEVS